MDICKEGVSQGFIMAGRAFHLPFDVAEFAFAAVALHTRGGFLAEFGGGLVLAGEIVVQHSHGFLGHIGREPAAALGAFGALDTQPRGFDPFGCGGVTENGIGYRGGDADGG